MRRGREMEKMEKRRGQTEAREGPLNGSIGIFRAEIRKQSTMDGIERRGKANRGCWYRTNDNKWHDATPKTVPIYSPGAVSADNVSRPLPPSCEPPDKISKIHRPPPEKSARARFNLPYECATEKGERRRGLASRPEFLCSPIFVQITYRTERRNETRPFHHSIIERRTRLFQRNI